jgi:hypothetical protein
VRRYLKSRPREPLDSTIAQPRATATRRVPPTTPRAHSFLTSPNQDRNRDVPRGSGTANRSRNARPQSAAELARSYNTATPEDHANVINLGRVEEDPVGCVRPAHAPKDPSLTVSAMLPSDRPIRA